MRWAAIGAALAFTGCAGNVTAGRYTMATDPGSRYAFRYVRDTQTRLWVHRECEARVSAKRKLPDSSTADGDRLHSQRFEPETVSSGDLVPDRFETPDGWRVWRFRHLPSEADRLGLGMGRPDRVAEPRRPERLGADGDVRLPADGHDGSRGVVGMDDRRRATRRRLRLVERSARAPAEPPKLVEYPFELRCRLLLKDHLYVD